MKIHKKIEQYSDEWWELRAGRLTASNAQAISANGAGLKTYVYEILAEKYSKNHESYTNAEMQRGTELEPIARQVYEIENMVTVKQVGLITDGDYVSCSPDGLVGKDGGLEIKCLNKTKHFKLLVNGEKEIENKYRLQCQMSMMISNRKWWDLAFYHPDFDKNLIVFRQYPDPNTYKKLKIGIATGTEQIKLLESKL